MKIHELITALEMMIYDERCDPDAAVRIRQQGRGEENIAILRDKEGAEVLLEAWE